MLKVYEVDYHGRAWLIGKAETITEAKKIARSALKKSKHEYPCFITDETKCIKDMR